MRVDAHLDQGRVASEGQLLYRQEPVCDLPLLTAILEAGRHRHGHLEGPRALNLDPRQIPTGLLETVLARDAIRQEPVRADPLVEEPTEVLPRFLLADLLERMGPEPPPCKLLEASVADAVQGIAAEHDGQRADNAVALAVLRHVVPIVA